MDEQNLIWISLDIKGDRVSRGHRFLGQETKIQSALSYEEDLSKQFNRGSREQMIDDQIKAIEAEHGVRIEIDADLLNEVLNLVWIPNCLLWEVLIINTLKFQKSVVTSMKEHQRYFVVEIKMENSYLHFSS